MQWAGAAFARLCRQAVSERVERLRIERCARHAGGREHVRAQIVAIALARQTLDNDSEQREAAVRISKLRARRELRPLRDDERQQVARRTRTMEDGNVLGREKVAETRR